MAIQKHLSVEPICSKETQRILYFAVTLPKLSYLLWSIHLFPANLRTKGR
jgi:hypothetical protein